MKEIIQNFPKVQVQVSMVHPDFEAICVKFISYDDVSDRHVNGVMLPILNATGRTNLVFTSKEQLIDFANAILNIASQEINNEESFNFRLQ